MLKKNSFKKIVCIVSVIVLLIMTLAFLTGCNTASSQNLIQNSTLSGATGNTAVPDNWRFDVFQEVEENVVEYGIGTEENSNYFYIDHTSRAYSALSQVIEVDKNTVYQISFEYRIPNASLQDSGIIREPSIGLNPGLNSGILQDSTFIGNPVYGQSSQNRWSISNAYINSGNNKKLTLAIRMGIPLASGSEIMSNLVVGRAEIRNISFRKYFSTTGLKIYTINGNESNLIKNQDFEKKDADGYPSYIGSIPKGAFSGGLPENWKFNSINGTTITREGLWQQNGLSVNYFQMALRQDTASISQKVKVEPNTDYIVSFYYYIPSTTDPSLDESVDADIKYLSGRIYQNNSPFNIGLHVAVLDDPMYSGKGAQTLESTTVNNASTTPWQFYFAYINSNSLRELEFAVRVGDIMSTVNGIVRVSGISIRKAEIDESVYSVHYVSSYNGYASTKTGGTIFFVLGVTIILIMSFIAVIILSVKRKTEKKKSSLSVKATALKAVNSENKEPSEEVLVDTNKLETDNNPANENENSSVRIEEQANNENTDKKEKQLGASNDTSKTLKAKQKSGNTIKLLKKIVSSPVFIVAIMAFAGFIARSILALCIRGYREDINLYVILIKAISDNRQTAIEQTGFLNPPLYLYILEAIGTFKTALGLHDTNIWFVYMLKLPNILADIVIGLTVFFATKKFASIKTAYVLSAFIFINPAAMVASSIWGEYDSFAIMFALLSIYFLLEKKYFLVVFLYTLSAMTKTSMHMIALPLIVYFSVTMFLAIRNIGILRNEGRMSKEALLSDSLSPSWKIPLYGLTALVLVYVISIRYCSEEISNNFFYPIIKFFFRNATEQTYFADNAFNMFALLGRNRPLMFEGSALIIAMNIIFAILILILSVILYMRRRNRANLLLVCCISVLLIFTFMVNMNPRYCFIALPLLLLAFATVKDKRLLILVFLYSIFIFSNMIAVMVQGIYLNNIPDNLLNLTQNSFYAGSDSLSNTVQLIIGSLFGLGLMLYTSYVVFDIIINNKREPIVYVNSPKKLGTIMFNIIMPKSIIKKNTNNTSTKD